MAAKRIPDLTALSGAGSANDDSLVIFDTSTNETKRILRSQLAEGLVGDLPYTPAGFISATTVPTAIAEVASDLSASGGASLVGFLQSGTGASSRTVQSKLRDVVSVLDFGADPTGVADSTTAIQNAINAADAKSTNGAVYLPAGTYTITTALSVPYGVSIYGDGGTASVISCLNCNGLNFNSATYDGGDMYVRDFAICGAAGTTGDRIAIQSILPGGGVVGTDSRDGLYFERLRIYDFNQAFLLASTWETHIFECRVFRCNQAVSLGNYAMLIRITNCNFTFEGGFATGTANKYGIELLGTVTEGAQICGNQIYGYQRAMHIADSIYVVFDGNDCSSSVYGVSIAGAGNTGLVISNNYFELSGNNAVGVFGANQASEISNLYEVLQNVFLPGGGSPTGTKGVQVGATGGTNSWNWRIRDNHFKSLGATDVEVWNTQNTIICGNRFESTAPTNNIVVNGGNASYHSNYIYNNKCAKAISVDATDLAANRTLVFHNIVSGSQSLGDAAFRNLDLTGSLDLITGSGNNAYIECAGGTNTVGASSALFGQNSSSVAYCWNRANEILLFGTNNSERVRIDASGNLIPIVQTAAPTLLTNQQMVFALTSNTNLRISVRGTDGVTRVANLTLA